MAKQFRLNILTPEREFYDKDVEAVTVTAPDGLVTILADHTPLIMPVSSGIIRIKKDSVWEESSNTEGFLEVTPESVLIFVQACEHPDEIDIHRAEEARDRAEERLKEKHSEQEYELISRARDRAIARIRVANSKDGL